MITLDTETKALLLENSVQREIIIRFPDATEDEITEIGSSNIIADSFELTHSICDSKEFVLGGCIAGQFTICVVGIEQALNNKRINVFIRQTYGTGDLYPSDELYPSEELYPGLQKETVEIQIFSGTIDSSLRQKNRSVKEIVAYDDIYRMSQTKCGKWLLGYIEHTTDFTLRELIYAAFENLEISTGILINLYSTGLSFNDTKVLSMDLSVAENVIKDDTTFVDLLISYCELNACFGIIDNEGRLKLIKLYNQASSASTAKKAVDEIILSYKELTFEEYITRPINRIRFKYKNNSNFDYGHSSTRESWYVSNNLITCCCTGINELVTAFNDNNGNNYIFYDLYSYRPFTADIFARWWIEPGDKVQIKTGYDDTEVVESFVFERTIKGINGMRVTLKAQGTEFLGKDEIESD